MAESPFSLPYNDLDHRIWTEELDELIPPQVFDAHTHVYRWEFNIGAGKEQGPTYELIGRQFPVSDWKLLDACDAQLMPGRQVHRLAFPFPFSPACDFEGSNRFVAAEAGRDPGSAALMAVHPSMTAEYLDEQIQRFGFLGFKPYRFYATTGDAVACRISDFLPAHQMEVADRRGLLVMLHLAKRDAIADPENIEDLIQLATRYARVKWILADLRGAIRPGRSRGPPRGCGICPTSGTTRRPSANPTPSRPCWPAWGPSASCTEATTSPSACCGGNTSPSAAPGPSFPRATTRSTCRTATRA